MLIAAIGYGVPVLIVAGCSLGILAVVIHIAIFGTGRMGPVPCYRCNGHKSEEAKADRRRVIDAEIAQAPTDVIATLTAVRWTLDQARQDVVVESVRHAIAVSVESVDNVIETLKQGES